MNDFSLTVRDIFANKHFQSAQLIAGENGLNNIIKWVHIVEQIDIRNIIKGEELILTTGINLLNNEEGFMKFIEELAAFNIAGLCIEYGQYIKKIPQKVISRANELNFPLIVFTEEVPFVEITQALHSLLINQQYELLKKLEEYAQFINKYSLIASNYEQLLIHLYKYLGLQVVCSINGQNDIMIPNINKEVFYKMQQEMGEESVATHIVYCDVQILDQHYGKVYLFSQTRIISDFDMLILDRTVVALSQYLLRNLFIEEKKSIENRDILDSWLTGRISKEEIQRFIEEVNGKCINSSWVVMIHQIKKSKTIQDLNYYKIFTRNTFEKLGFYSFILERNNHLIFIMADLRDKKSYKNRIKQALNNMQGNSNKYSESDSIVAIGKYVGNYSQLKNSYDTANDTLIIRRTKPYTSYFYDDLYLYHIILKIQQNPAMMELVEDSLLPLYEHDEKHNSKLVETLQVYLKTQGLKKETAKRLFIVRQTLYHRLEKIEKLIGNDFMEPDKRLALELMLLTHQK